MRQTDFLCDRGRRGSSERQYGRCDDRRRYRCIKKTKRSSEAVLLFTVCLHHFLGCDLERVYEELEARFPDIFFVRCYMDPIMQKHGLTPDQKLRKAIYDGLKVREENPKAVTILAVILRWMRPVISGVC